MEELDNRLKQLLEKKHDLKQQIDDVKNEIAKLRVVLNKKPQGRPAGSVSSYSLESLVLKCLNENKAGYSFPEIVSFILKSGYKTSASTSEFNKMVKIRLGYLRRKKTIVYDNALLVFKLNVN